MHGYLDNYVLQCNFYIVFLHRFNKYTKKSLLALLQIIWLLFCAGILKEKLKEKEDFNRT